MIKDQTDRNGSCLWKLKTVVTNGAAMQDAMGSCYVNVVCCCLQLWLEDYLPTLLCFNNWTLEFWNFSTFRCCFCGPPLIEKIGQSLISEKLSSGTWPHFPQLITFCILDGWLGLNMVLYSLSKVAIIPFPPLHIFMKVKWQQIWKLL